MELLISVDPATDVPLHRQVYDGIRHAILSGHLRPGDRLPATRSLAEQLSLSRQTVTDAYDQLEVEGYVRGRRGSGTYVAPDVLEDSRLSAPIPHGRLGSDTAIQLSAWGDRVLEGGRWPVEGELEGARLDLRPHRVASDVFPWDAWSEAVGRAMRGRQELLAALPAAGHAGLRAAIAAHVRRYRGVHADAESVVVVNGSQQGLNLLAQILLDGEDRVAVEDPGYPAARLALQARGLDVARIPVDADGMQVEQLAGRSYRLIYVTPSHQYPTGATLSVSRRLALLDIARAQGAIVVEDDYDSEFRYEGRPIESLQGLDGGTRVVYFGSFSKSVFPGLRIGYVILPQHLVEPFVVAKAIWDGGTPMLEQAALVEFMHSGDFERHIRRMRRLYRGRRNALVGALRREFGPRVRIGPSHGGLSVLVEVDASRKAEDIVRAAADEGVAIRSATPCYAVPPPLPRFLLGFGSCDEEQLAEAIALLARAAPRY